jgi:uncharacterized lipoprotein YddW (UPF0748 family)
MRSTCERAALVGLCGMLIAANICLAQDPEYRAMWVSRFEWPDANEATCKARIDAIMNNLKANNFNAVFFQVRGQCDVLYPSPYEPWSHLIGGADPGWDPLAYAIEKAHANGLEFHAYINTHTCYLGPSNASRSEPKDKSHVFFLHCKADDPDHRDWLIHNAAGEPVQWHENDYVWIAPGVPSFHAYWRKQVMYVVENYDVDGVQFDRIRTPNSSFSYDPISMARFADPQSNPNGLDFHAWTADQITRLVRDLYAQIMAVKPHVKVSASPFPDPNSGPTSVHQDARAWIQTGSMDMLLPMMYSTGGAGSTWDARLQAWLAGSNGRHILASHSTSQGGDSLLEQVALTRSRGAAGNCVFSYSSFNFWNNYKTSVYQQPASLPAMSWKTNPTTGIIYGYVMDPDGNPVTDAQVVRSGSSYVGLSSADGIYSFLLVPPGTYTLTAVHRDHGESTISNVTVAAGQVVRRDFTTWTIPAPIIAEVSPDPDQATVGLEYVRQLTLSQGVASSWTLLSGPAGATISATGRVYGWKPARTQAGQQFTFTVQASNPTGSDTASWQVVVPVPPPCALVRLSDFEGYANGAEVLFQEPRYSGTTQSHLLDSPNVRRVTDAVTAFSGTKCYEVQWQFVDATPQRWMRLTTHDAVNVKNPTVELNRPIRVRLRLDSGRLRVAVGIRETGTTADVGADGGATGTIEFIGAAGKISDAPQGVLVEANPGVWQTIVFDPRFDPIVPLNGDAILSAVTNKGVFECLAFSAVDSAGPFTVYIDDVDQLCALPGDFDYDSRVNLTDLVPFESCISGPMVPHSGTRLCRQSDLDEDGDVDQDDFALFQRCYSGTDLATDPHCAD